MASSTTDRRLGLTGSAAVKVPCKAATTANITLSGTQTIDGVSCTTGDRVLVKSQTSSVDNGVYVCDSGTWTRDLDFDGSNDVVTGTLVPVNDGTANGEKVFRVTTTGTITFGSSLIAFEQALLSSLTGAKFTQSGTGAVEREAQDKMRDAFSVTDFGAVPDGTTSNTSVFATAIAAVPTNGVLRFPPTAAGGTYMGVISVRRSDITLQFEGVTIKQPASTSAPAVLELGDTASGNSATAYSNINIIGKVTLDGNKASITAPTSDLTGHGLAMTKISNYQIRGVRAVNCYNAGVGIFIDSNQGNVDCIVDSCGNATYTGPGFDINSSKFITGNVVSYGCYDGARVLDNCWGNNIRASVFNATRHGFVYNNQSTNASYNNNLDVTVYTAGTNGFVVGLNCRSSNIRAAIYNTSVGMNFTNDANHSKNLNIDLSTDTCGSQGLILYGDDCIIRHQSYLDGRSGAQGSVYAVDVNGNRNKLSVDLIDSSTWQVRGIAVRSGATDNEIVSYSFTNTADPLNDSGTRTKVNHGQGRGADITSSNTISIPVMGSIFHVTGNTGIASMSGFGQKDQFITLIFDGTPTVTKGSNLKLSAAGNLVATANSTLSGVWDGTNFYETGRSVT